MHCALCQHHINDAEELQCTLDHLSTMCVFFSSWLNGTLTLDANTVNSHGISSDKAEQGTHYIPDAPDQNPTSVITTALKSDANVG